MSENLNRGRPRSPRPSSRPTAPPNTRRKATHKGCATRSRRLVVDAYVALADLPAGKRPTRTVVGLTWGVDEMNAAKQPIQDRILREMQLEGTLGGVSA